jgi:hypothetical protein
MPRPLCRHCCRVPANRPRGLCWSCFYKPGVRDQYPPVKLCGWHDDELNWRMYSSGHAEAPIAAEPGTEAKIQMLAARVKARQELHHPGDFRRDRLED